jgi:hypothetical protein
MTSREKIEEVINQLNEDGLKLMISLCSMIPNIEVYNINTTPERLAELKQIDEQKKEHNEKQDEERLRMAR